MQMNGSAVTGIRTHYQVWEGLLLIKEASTAHSERPTRKYKDRREFVGENRSEKFTREQANS